MAENDSEMSRSAPIAEVPAQTIKRAHAFPFLDGLRGYAALWVMIGHAHAECMSIGLKGVSIVRLLTPIYESWAVPVFIALSGFLLTSQVCHPSKLASHNPVAFMVRRGRRIYPSYLVAILFCLLVTGAYKVSGIPQEARWQDAGPVDVLAILSHLALIHNWFPAYIHKIEPPMWSLGVEWQIYIAFAFFTVPLIRKFGWIPAAILTAVLIAGTAKLDSGFAVLFASFAMGGVAAYLRHQRLSSETSGTQPYVSMIAATLGTILAFALHNRGLYAEMLVSASAAFGVYALSHPQTEKGFFHWLGGLMESRLSKFFGWCSYSLYLVHFPIISAVAAASLYFGLKGTPLAVAILLGGWSLSIGLAALFARHVEYVLVNKAK